MLDQSLKEQLKTVFGSLENTVNLVYELSHHADQAELVEMLQEVASTSTKISALPSQSVVPVSSPQFHIEYQGRHTGITFKAIPGGHEFTSLILAILNTDGKGKMPEDFLVKKIRQIKHPIKMQTYMSLSCENCPDVVQSLNQIALIHGNFEHEIIDGAYAQDEIKKIGIQGVPSLIVNSQLVHSGRIQLLDLVAKLEEIFGTEGAAQATPEVNVNLGHFEVVVVGGGPAGASAAIYSVRKGLSTALLTEKVGGQVQDTKGIENLISIPYTEGPQLAGQLYQHMKEYPIKIFENRRVKSVQNEAISTIHLESGEFLTASSVIIATGAKWRELGVPGEKEYIGKGVAFCPHCDGPYYRGKKVAVIGGGNSGVEAAIDLAGIVGEVVLLEFNDQLRADKVLVEKLVGMSNISILTNAKTLEILGDGQKVNALEYLDRLSQSKNKISLDGVFVQIGLVPNSGFLKDTVELSKFGEIVVDNKGRTSVPGIYAAGDVTTSPFKQIIIAMGDGAKVALAAFEDRMYAHK